MASKLSLREEDYSCPVCRDVFTVPVLLSCSHSFCKDCLQNWWRQKNIKECPVCKKIHSKGTPPIHLSLKNLCKAFVQERQQRASKRQKISSLCEDLCRLHEAKLKLFCQECQQPLCVVCLHSKEHTDHTLRPIEKAALEHKQEVQKSLKPLQEKRKLFIKAKINCDQTAELLKVQAQSTERQIRDQFKKLHHFLLEEEEASITALREEEQQKSQTMTETIEGLNRDILTLSNNIRAIEEELREERISFLHNYTLLTLQDTRLVSGIDAAKHLGNLTFRVWDKMKDIVSYTPVILDPNTAHPRYSLSDDLTSVGDGESQQIPDNPERFDTFPFVLGSEGFNSGTHSWDVEVGYNANWMLGVLSESFPRKGRTMGKFWRIGLYEGKYTACSSPELVKSLSVTHRPRRIRVQLDWNKGKLSFSDPDTDTHLHTFRQAFTETLFPYVNTESFTFPLRMLPGKISVTLEQVQQIRGANVQPIDAGKVLHFVIKAPNLA